MSEEKIKVAVLGYGHLGKWHCQKVDLCEQAQLVAICDVTEQGRIKAQENHPHAQVTENYLDCLDSADTFFVITPTSYHYSIVKELISAGKNVFCEKPLCETLDQALELYQLSQKSEGVCMVGHSERCHKAWEHLKGDFKPLFIELSRLTPFKGRAADVSVIDDLMIHDIDLVHYLTGAQFVEVETLGFSSVTEKIDFASVTGKLSNGALVKIISHRDSPTELRQGYFVNSTRSLKVDMMKSQIIENEPQDYEKRDHLLIEHQSFYQAIQNKSEPLTSLLDGLKAVAVVEAIKKSIKDKAAVTVHYGV